MTSRAPRRPAAFLDRDGVVNVDHGYVSRRADFDFVPGVLEGARRLRELGCTLVVVTNQSGIGRGLYTEQDFLALTTWMRGVFEAAGAPLAGVYYCPHYPDGIEPYGVRCDCRKPAPGMLLDAARDLDLDLPSSVMFGDRASDLEAARAAGVPYRVLLATDGSGAPVEVEPGLATHRAARLDEALDDADLVRNLRAPAHSR
jgi:D-glycero-D-manno-heptose 1,7-bisphosphate phosphatase